MTTPRLILVAGANGAGKSTMTARLMKRFGSSLGVLIDADAFASALAPDNPSRAAISAGRLTLALLERALQHRERVMYETTLSDRKRSLNLLQHARNLGFETWVFYIGLDDPQMHLERVVQRSSVGGHDVPDADILRRFERSRANLPAAIRLADRAMIYDNSGRDFKLAASLERGNLRRSSGTGWWTPLLPVSEE